MGKKETVLKKATNDVYVQGSFFEEDYLIRTLGNLGTSPEVALTELVANAWDAGATQVDITVPEKIGELLKITDNGVGLTKDEFYERWMKLGYNRLKHQGKKVVFPKNVEGQRMAYGRNGVGRHGMLCFNDEYKVLTRKDRKGTESEFIVTTQNKTEPFVIKAEKFGTTQKHGTTLSVVVEKNLPKADRILEVLSARFLHDPKFKLTINKQSVALEQHSGLVDTKDIEVNGKKLKVHLVDSKKARNSTQYQGIAFWQSGRLVGEPSWIVGTNMVLDGRTKFAKKFTAIVETNDLEEYILEDWTGFKKSDDLIPVFDEVSNTILEMFKKVAKDHIEETTNQIKQDFQSEYQELSPLAKYEFNETIERIAIDHPTATQESMTLAVQTVLMLEKTRSGLELLQKISGFTEEDVDGLNTILDKWTIKDALTVLDEIDNRLSVIEAIRKLSKDPNVDELNVLHPLVASARWVFGPEFDSPEFSSNSQLQTTVQKLFDKRIDKNNFTNHKKRPDIVVLADSVISVTGTETFDTETSLSMTNKVLLIELKRGKFKLSRAERDQATGYVEDFGKLGTLINSPFIHAFVVGDSFNEKISPFVTVQNENKVDIGKVQICLFSQIVDSAEKRLFGLRKRLDDRYANVPGMELYNRQAKQLELEMVK